MKKIRMLAPLMLLAFCACKKIKTEDPPLPKNQQASLDIILNPCMFGNCWTLQNPFPGAFNLTEGFFTINNKAYYASYSTHPEPMWVYDGSTWTTGPALSPPIVYCGTVFSIGSKGYAAFSQLPPLTKEFYSFDPASNQWTKLPDFPGAALGGGTGKAFSIGNKGYTVTYEPAAVGSGYRFVLWEFNVATGTWAAKADLPKPGGLEASPGAAFAIGAKIYMLLNAGSQTPSSVSLFYEFDPASNIWKVLPDMPGGRRYDAASFVIGSDGYIGTGRTASNTRLNDFYRYRPSNNTWLKVKDYPGGITAFAMSFSINSRGYVLDRYNQTLPAGSNCFYSYKPSTIIN